MLLLQGVAHHYFIKFAPLWRLHSNWTHPWSWGYLSTQLWIATVALDEADVAHEGFPSDDDDVPDVIGLMWPGWLDLFMVDVIELCWLWILSDVCVLKVWRCTPHRSLLQVRRSTINTFTKYPLWVSVTFSFLMHMPSFVPSVGFSLLHPSSLHLLNQEMHRQAAVIHKLTSRLKTKSQARRRLVH